MPEVPPIAERLASVLPEFAGAYRDGGLVVRVTDPAFARSGGESAARALLQRELKARGRGDLSIRFEAARYDYRRLKSWLDMSLDSLGAYRAVSWSIDQRTSQVRAGFADVASQRRFEAAAAKLGVPGDAIATVLDSPDSIFQGTTLNSKVRPIKGGLITMDRQWHDEGDAGGWPCTLTGIFLQGTYPEFVTASHCVISSAHGGDLNWMVYQDVLNGSGFCNVANECVGTIDNNPAFSYIAGCPTNQFCRNADAASGYLVGNTGLNGLVGTIALPLNGPVAPPETSTPKDISTTSNIVLTGGLSAIFLGDTLSKIGYATGWTKGVVVDPDVTRNGTDGLYRLHNARVQAGSTNGDSGAPVLWLSSGNYYLAGLLWGGGTVDGLQYFSVSKWTYIQSDLGFTNVR